MRKGKQRRLAQVQKPAKPVAKPVVASEEKHYKVNVHLAASAEIAALVAVASKKECHLLDWAMDQVLARGTTFQKTAARHTEHKSVLMHEKAVTVLKTLCATTGTGPCVIMDQIVELIIRPELMKRLGGAKTTGAMGSGKPHLH